MYLLHDNARPHIANVVKEYLVQKGITLWDHPSYSQDISPLDFGCFGVLKRRLRGVRHENWSQFESALEVEVERLNSEGLMEVIEQLLVCWESVIEAEGEYI